MRKKFLTILLVFLLMLGMLIGLTACGNNDKDDEEDEASGPEAVVEEYCEYLSSGKFKKAFDLIDWEMYLMVDDGYDYDELEDKDTYEEFKEDNEYYLDNIDEQIEYAIDEYSEIYEDAKKFEVKVKSIEDAEKVKGTKNVYSVEAKIKINVKDEYGDENTSTEDCTIYLMKKSGKYYIIDGIDAVMESIAW